MSEHVVNSIWDYVSRPEKILQESSSNSCDCCLIYLQNESLEGLQVFSSISRKRLFVRSASYIIEIAPGIQCCTISFLGDKIVKGSRDYTRYIRGVLYLRIYKGLRRLYINGCAAYKIEILGEGHLEYIDFFSGALMTLEGLRHVDLSGCRIDYTNVIGALNLQSLGRVKSIVARRIEKHGSVCVLPRCLVEEGGHQVPSYAVEQAFKVDPLRLSEKRYLCSSDAEIVLHRYAQIAKAMHRRAKARDALL